jgi:hypothetical protein
VDDNFDSTPFSDEEEEKILLKAYKSDIPAKMSEVI